jgi:5-(carboxyamino)imidazole ribonucleotide synthase
VGAEALARAAREIGGPCRAKAAQGGYDGRGQARLESPADAEEVFSALGGAPAVVEKELALEAELSVLVARTPSGEVRTHPPSRNWHVDSILDVCHIPSELPGDLETAACSLAVRIAEAAGLEGILAVEMFVVGGEILINEMAPRPHNTFHTTTHATQVSQFEQLVRAVCDLPLGSTAVVQPVALANLLGDLWLGDGDPNTAALLAMEGLHLYLYDKTPRPKRKVGHLLATGATSAVALERVRKGREALKG